MSSTFDQQATPRVTTAVPGTTIEGNGDIPFEVPPVFFTRSTGGPSDNFLASIANQMEPRQHSANGIDVAYALKNYPGYQLKVRGNKFIAWRGTHTSMAAEAVPDSSGNWQGRFRSDDAGVLKCGFALFTPDDRQRVMMFLDMPSPGLLQPKAGVLIVEPQDFENWPRLLESCEAAGSEATFLADVDGHSKSFKVTAELTSSSPPTVTFRVKDDWR